jgi:protein AroM
MPSLGVVTIGQSPRDDLTGELAAYLPAGTRLLERGALDDLTSPAITALAPDAEQDTPTSRLRDGESVMLDRRRLVPLLEQAVCALERRGQRPTCSYAQAPSRPCVTCGRCSMRSTCS